MWARAKPQRAANTAALAFRGTASYRELPLGSRTDGVPGFPNVNARFKQEPPRKRLLPDEDNRCGQPSQRHWQSTWSEAEVRQAARDHAMLTWSGCSAIDSLPILERAEGVYVYDTTGKKYLDWTSEAVCVNLGHTVPESVKEAMVQQMEQTPFVYGGIGFVPVRAQLAALLAELAPGDLNGFLFPSSGSEANDCAIRLARLYTGKTKIFNQYRSYHGGTLAPLGATGDFRRRFAQDSATGFVKMFNPEPHYFRWGDTDERACEMALACLEEQIVAEGPSTIAAIMVESIPGSAGVLIPAVGFMEGIRSLCNQYEILMICDEVMTGFGRTGELFGFQHFDGVIPDIVTSAKGLTGSWQPLSMVGVRQKLKDFFFDKATGWGSTFQAHPVAMACGYASLKYMLDQKLLTHVQTVIQPIMIEELDRLVSKYDFVKQARCVGAFGCLDLIDPQTGERVMQLGEPLTKEMQIFKKAFNNEGLIGFLRPPQVHCAPPLIISEGELRDGFQRLDRALNVLQTSFQDVEKLNKVDSDDMILTWLTWSTAASADVVTFSAACSALARGERRAPDGWQLPLELLRSFQQRSLEFDAGAPDSVVFCASVLSACEKGPRWEACKRDQSGFGAAISACRKGSNWQGAWALLEDIWSSALQPDLVAFNATISSCEKAQRWEFAIELLEMMSLQQVPPDVVSFNATASACEKRAQWSWALWVFSQLKRTIPVEKQKGALLNISNACVSACAKALRWQEALLLGQQIDRPDKVTYNGLLCACRASGGSRWPMLLQLVIEMSRHLVMPGVDA
ncbi:Uncharacterized aminotransferase YodT [Durusdinium trenchii]|uniref:Uncharacterized aminotransferase YodT n=1 Tax=Durusdinium trenchii TaxID=1381693 RepID=A0ABP0LBE3_9DINO